MNELDLGIKELKDYKSQQKHKALISDVDFNNISEVLRRYKELRDIEKLFENAKQELNVKIKTYLKERQWESYNDDKSNITVRFISINRINTNYEYLKKILSENQYHEAITTSSYERMDVITPEDRERLSKYVP